MLNYLWIIRGDVLFSNLIFFLLLSILNHLYYLLAYCWVQFCTALILVIALLILRFFLLLLILLVDVLVVCMLIKSFVMAEIRIIARSRSIRRDHKNRHSQPSFPLIIQLRLISCRIYKEPHISLLNLFFLRRGFNNYKIINWRAVR
jgi:hypothetical protein